MVSEDTKRKISLTNKKLMGEMRERFIDKTVHVFYNRLTKEKFEGTSFHFSIKNPHLSYFGIRLLVRGIRKHTGKKKEWLLLTLPQPKHH